MELQNFVLLLMLFTVLEEYKVVAQLPCTPEQEKWCKKDGKEFLSATKDRIWPCYVTCTYSDCKENVNLPDDTGCCKYGAVQTGTCKSGDCKTFGMGK